MNNTKETMDKISWNNINQLHDAVSNFSKQSFDIKKLWITVEISIITLLININEGDLTTIIITASFVLLFFYFLDCMTYYYQDKLRENIKVEQNNIRKRHEIKPKDIDRNEWRVLRSFFNWSHLLYYVVGLILVVFFFVCKCS